MAQLPTSVCITCGMATGEIAQLNRLPNGQICPTCRERVLDSIPAALPATVSKSSLDLRLEAESNREVEYDAEVRPWPPHGYGTR